MKTWLAAIAAALALLCSSALMPALAQAPTARVVTTCPGAAAFAAGSPGTLTVDVNGNICTSGGGGGLTGNLGNNVDNVPPVTTGNIGTISYVYTYDGTNWDRGTTINAGTAGVAGNDVLSVQFPVGGLPFHTICDSGCTGGGGSSSITNWGGGTLGAMANFGSSPGAVLVPGVNAFITNIPAVSQSGAWNVTNISGTVSLPTGAATSANQATAAAQASTTAGQTGPLVQCAVTTAAPTYTTAQTDPFSCDTSGNVRVNVANANANGPATPANSSPVVVAGKTAEVCVSPTVTASAYTAGNIVGGKLTLANAFTAVGSGVLQSVRLTFKSVQTAEFDIYQFSANPTGSTWTDKAAPAIVAADALLARPPIKLFNNSSGLGTHTVYGADAIGRAVSVGATSDYFVIITTGTPTPASTTDVQFCASYLQD
jgi:hypothetical protein